MVMDPGWNYDTMGEVELRARLRERDGTIARQRDGLLAFRAERSKEIGRLERSRADLRQRNLTLVLHDDCEWRHVARSKTAAVDRLVNQLQAFHAQGCTCGERGQCAFCRVKETPQQRHARDDDPDERRRVEA